MPGIGWRAVEITGSLITAGETSNDLNDLNAPGNFILHHITIWMNTISLFYKLAKNIVMFCK